MPKGNIRKGCEMCLNLGMNKEWNEIKHKSEMQYYCMADGHFIRDHEVEGVGCPAWRFWQDGEPDIDKVNKGREDNNES